MSTEEQLLKKIIPNWEKRKVEVEKGGKLTDSEKDLLQEYFSGQFSDCLANSNISLEGQKKIQETMLETLVKGR